MDITTDQAILLWHHYEEVAMHFNELIIQYRIQLMSGAGIIGVASSYFIVKNKSEGHLNYKLIAFISTSSFILLSAAAVLDLGYYNELLRGAVEAIVELEKQHKKFLYMSTCIKDQFGSSGASIRIYAAYGIIMIPLLILTIWSWIKIYSTKSKSD